MRWIQYSEDQVRSRPRSANNHEELSCSPLRHGPVLGVL